MNVGFDLDGVLYPWHDAVYGWCINNDLTKVDYDSFWSDWWWNKNTMFQMNIVNDPTLYETFMPTEQHMQFIKDIAKKHTIFYVTGRPIELDRVTRRFMEKCGYPFTDNIIFSKDKAMEVVRNRIDVFVEDFYQNAAEIAKHCKSFLVNAPYNRHNKGNTGVTRIDSIYELKGLLL